jgi:hypothetical protein
MASFLTGLMSVGKKLGSSAKDWAHGTKVGQDIDAARTGQNPWSQGRSRPTPSQQSPGGATTGTQIGDQKDQG